MAFQRIISVIGLGYVGLTTAAAFSQITKVIAFDCNESRIEKLKKGHDENGEVSDEDLTSKNLHFTTNPNELEAADFHIITVPTPLDKLKHPNLSMLLSASEMLGKQLKKGDIIVYESTVYPGATEEECIPVLESSSNLICGKDFSVGFSPERINPADKEHVFQTIVKIVSGSDKKTLDIIADAYERVVKAGVFRVSSIRIAEAAKVIENTQRDVNIALMNDLAIILHALGIDTREVLAAMKTKWNYLPFEPGLVGGHCIGVNSYYLMHKAEEVNCHSDIIYSARRVNESIAKFIVNETIKRLIHRSVLIKGSRIGILGLTYKENCADLRDTGVISIINELKSYDVQVFVQDPLADYEVAKREYGIELVDWDDLVNLDAIILTVAHQKYTLLTKEEIILKLKPSGLVVDIKKVLNMEQVSDDSISIWRL